MSRYKYLEDKAKEKNKKLLIENVLLDSNSTKVEWFDKPQLVESLDKGSFSARGIVKNVKVSKFTENLNGRIYSKQLDERIIANKFAEGSLSLADHPDDDGSITRICGVWHNARVDENFAYGDWYLVGDHGQLILETLKAGGKVGVSRVGFGEFLEDGKTVDPESYELERYGDAVIRPSQEVFAEFENVNENLNESIQHKKENVVIEKEITNKIISENKIEVRNMDKMTEATFKNQIRSAIKEAIANENYVEAIKELKEVSKTIPSEMVEQVAQVESAIMQVQEKISQDKDNAEKELKESKETLESLTEKYNTACNTIDQLKENLDKASKIVEKSSDPEVVKSMKLMEADIDQFTSDRELMEADIKLFVEEIKNRDSDLAIYEEDTEKRDADIKRFIEGRKQMKGKITISEKQLKQAEKHIKKLESILEDEYGFEFDDGNLMVATEEYAEPSIYDAYDDEVIGDDMVDDYLVDEFDIGYEAGYEDAVGNSYEDEFYEAEDKDEDDEDKDDKDLEESEDDKDDEEEDDDDKMAKVRAAKKESSNKIKPEVISYYKAAVKETPALKDIKESILKSGSVFDAVKKVRIFEQKFGNDVHRLKEDILETRNRKFKPYKLSID